MAYTSQKSVFLSHTSLKSGGPALVSLRPQPARAQLPLSPWLELASPGRLEVEAGCPGSSCLVLTPFRRKEERKEKGMLSSCKDASQGWHTPFPLTSHRLELCHIATPASRGWKIDSFFLKTLCLATKWGFYYYRSRGSGCFGELPSTQPSFHSPQHTYFYIATVNYL